MVAGTAQEQSDAKKELTDLYGWRISMEEKGEKILAHSSTLGGVVRFVSYVPAQATNICAANLGTSHYWAVSLDNATPFVDEESANGNNVTAADYKSEIPGSGIAPPIATIFVEHEGEITPTDVSGINTIHEWNDLNMTKRWFWAENPD